VYIRPKTVVPYIGYSASYSQNFEKSTVFFIEEKICYKMVYTTLCHSVESITSNRVLKLKLI